MKILILGATGMLGNMMIRVLNESKGLTVYGTVRTEDSKSLLPRNLNDRLIICSDVLDIEKLTQMYEQVMPDVVINCVGLVKQLAAISDPLNAIPINSLLPHQLAKLCLRFDSRLIHISTDCVFSGSKGNYKEIDPVDANDLYGLSKYLGEVRYPHAVTLRTSIIGHELRTAHSIVDWFMSQKEQCLGYTRAIFSGIPAVVLAGIIRDYVLNNLKLSGLYHVSSKPISKYELLSLISEIYEKKIIIVPDDRLKIDRSLNSNFFTDATGFVAPTWDLMIDLMHRYK